MITISDIFQDKDTDQEFVEVNQVEGAFWTDLFVNCFLCYDETQTKNELNHDDMLFFVSKLDPQEVTIQYNSDLLNRNNA